MDWQTIIDSKEWPIAKANEPFLDIPNHTSITVEGNEALAEELHSVPNGEILVLYDILDHIDDPVIYLKNKNFNKILVRCHPWISRHGSHHYEKINKAFIHLIIPPSKLLTIAGIGKKTIKINNPFEEYEKWFMLSEFTIKYQKVHRTKIEDWIIDNFNWELSKNIGFTKNGISGNLIRCSIDYIDYYLER